MLRTKHSHQNSTSQLTDNGTNSHNPTHGTTSHPTSTQTTSHTGTGHSTDKNSKRKPKDTDYSTQDVPLRVDNKLYNVPPQSTYHTNTRYRVNLQDIPHARTRVQIALDHSFEFRHNLETWITGIGTKEIPSGEKRGREDDGQSPISKKVATGQGDVDPIPSLNPNDGNLGTSSDAQTATQNPGRTITLTLKKKANLKTKLRNDKMMTGRLYQIVTVGPIDNDKLEELII